MSSGENFSSTISATASDSVSSQDSSNTENEGIQEPSAPPMAEEVAREIFMQTSSIEEPTVTTPPPAINPFFNPKPDLMVQPSLNLNTVKTPRSEYPANLGNVPSSQRTPSTSETTFFQPPTIEVLLANQAEEIHGFDENETDVVHVMPPTSKFDVQASKNGPMPSEENNSNKIQAEPAFQSQEIHGFDENEIDVVHAMPPTSKFDKESYLRNNPENEHIFIKDKEDQNILLSIEEIKALQEGLNYGNDNPAYSQLLSNLSDNSSEVSATINAQAAKAPNNSTNFANVALKQAVNFSSVSPFISSPNFQAPTITNQFSTTAVFPLVSTPFPLLSSQPLQPERHAQEETRYGARVKEISEEFNKPGIFLVYPNFTGEKDGLIQEKLEIIDEQSLDNALKMLQEMNTIPKKISVGGQNFDVSPFLKINEKDAESSQCMIINDQSKAEIIEKLKEAAQKNGIKLKEEEQKESGGREGKISEIKENEANFERRSENQDHEKQKAGFFQRLVKAIGHGIAAAGKMLTPSSSPQPQSAARVVENNGRSR